MTARACAACGGEILTKRRNARFCGPGCRDRHYRATNLEKVREKDRRYHAANREHVREKVRRWLEAHPDTDRHRRYYAAHRERVMEKVRRWHEANPDKRRAAGHIRRAREVAALVERVSPLEVYERDGWRCGLCRRVIHRHLAHPHPGSATLDHIIPLARGGTHEYRNVQAAHLRCNSRKQARVLGHGEQLRLIG